MPSIASAFLATHIMAPICFITGWRHENTDSTRIYTKRDIEKLRTLSLAGRDTRSQLDPSSGDICGKASVINLRARPPARPIS